jgi:DNA-binding transcriptional MerR regulator
MTTKSNTNKDAVLAEDDLLTIHAAGERYGLTHRALRFYESRGLLAPARVGGRRIYDATQVRRIEYIVKFKELGFSVAEILGLVEAQADRDPSEGYVIDRETAKTHIAFLEERRAVVDSAIAELRQSIDRKAA